MQKQLSGYAQLSITHLVTVDLNSQPVSMNLEHSDPIQFYEKDQCFIPFDSTRHCCIGCQCLLCCQMSTLLRHHENQPYSFTKISCTELSATYWHSIGVGPGRCSGRIEWPISFLTVVI